MGSPESVSYISLLLVVLGRQLCLPLPADLALIVAGAAIARGELSLPLVVVLSVTGCIIGDFAWFVSGRKWGNRVLDILCRFSISPSLCRQRAHRSFARWGLKSLLIAKFVPGLDAITPPIAGIEGASPYAFCLADAGGSLLWTLAYVLCGYVFRSELAFAVKFVIHFGVVLFILVGIPLLLLSVSRSIQLIQMIRRLRLHTISPHQLREKLNRGERIVVIDLLRFEDAGTMIEGIPGAVRMDPSRLESHNKTHLPKDVELVLYSSSLGKITTARVALALQRRGLEKVYVLEGGLDAWKADGLPLTSELSTRDEIAARLGPRAQPQAE